MGERQKNPLVKEILTEATEKRYTKDRKQIHKSLSKCLDKADELQLDLKELNLMQTRFCHYYAANGGNATQAAIKAGYSEGCAGQTGRTLLSYPQIVQRLNEIEQDKMAAVDFTIEYKYRLLKKCAVVLDKELDKKEKATTAKALVAVLSETNKMAGHYSPVRQQTENIHVLTDNENKLAELVEKYQQEC